MPPTPHRWLAVDGRATLEDEGAGEHIDMLAVRYEGPGAARISARGERRVIVRIRPERVEHEGLGDPGLRIDQKVDMIGRRACAACPGSPTA